MRGLDGLAEFVDSGRTAVLGLVPATLPENRPSVEEVSFGGPPSPTASAFRNGARYEHRHQSSVRDGWVSEAWAGRPPDCPSSAQRKARR